MSSATLTRWLQSHGPQGMRPEGPVESVTSSGRTGRELTFAGRGTSVHTTPFLDLVFVTHGGGQAVRLTTFLGARFARAAEVPADTATVLVRWTTAVDRQGPPNRTVSRRVTTPTAVRRLVALVNRLPGSMTVPFVASCPVRFRTHTVLLTFDGPSGRYALEGQDGLCWPQLTLSHGGTPVGPTLDPDRRFFGAVDRFLREGATASAR